MCSGGRGTLRSADKWLEVLIRTPELPHDTRLKLNQGEPVPMLADILINGALTVTAAQCVVVSMFTPDHIARNCRAISDGSTFTAEELTFLMRALNAARLSEAGSNGSSPTPEP